MRVKMRSQSLATMAFPPNTAYTRRGAAPGACSNTAAWAPSRVWKRSCFMANCGSRAFSFNGPSSYWRGW